MEGKHQNERLKQAQMLFGQSRHDDYLKWKEDFTRLTGSEDKGMTAELYAQYRESMRTSFNKSMIEFSLGDLDNSGKLNRHEFALLMNHLFMVPDGRSLRIDPRQESRAPFSVVFQGVDPVATSHAVGSAPIQSNAVVDGFRCCEELKPKTDWRGILVQREHDAFTGAKVIADHAARLAARINREWDCNPWVEFLMFGSAKTLADAAHRIIVLCDEVLRIIKNQPVMVRCYEPCKVFGDIHGQLSDLLLLFNKFGFPSTSGGDIEICSYVFNGDWVDRGPHQLEVLVLLFSLKILYPARVWLVRGNHEFKSMNEKYGFQKQVLDRLMQPEMAKVVYDKIHEVFSYLPLSAVVANSVLVLHGGIGNGNWGLRDLAKIKRPIQDKDEQGRTIILPDIVVQTLWSDPIMSDDASNVLAQGVHPNPQRGDGVAQFGADITEAFCKRLYHLEYVSCIVGDLQQFSARETIVKSTKMMEDLLSSPKMRWDCCDCGLRELRQNDDSICCYWYDRPYKSNHLRKQVEH